MGVAIVRKDLLLKVVLDELQRSVRRERQSAPLEGSASQTVSFLTFQMQCSPRRQLSQ